MPRLFGTDGIRGIANVDLKPTVAYALGRAVAHRLAGPGGAIVVGQDTRRSGDMFVAAIAAGATSMAVDVHVVGVVPTPALAYLAGHGPFAAGIMVSASHNPADDNGLKVLDRDGLKLDDAIEDELEQLIWRTEELAGATNATLGRMIDASERLGDYLAHRIGLASSIDARGVHLVYGANGSDAWWGLDPRGDRRPGRGHPCRARRREHQRPGQPAPAGGGGRGARTSRRPSTATRDRLIAVDAGGRVVDGDQVLGILALDRLERGELPGGGLVVSVLSNGGLQAVVERAGGQVVRTPVGDKYILEGMQVSGAMLGGEKSGHVIVLEHTTSGDGIVTALEVLRVMGARRASLAELAAAIPMLPQQQRAVKARHKDQWEGDPALQRAIAAASVRLGESGRVLVRPSGTEPALRVMVEGSDEALVAELADALAALAGERLN
jgi:phosphoglucosamine mutase